MLFSGVASAGELPLLLVPATPPPGFSNGSIGYAMGVRSSSEPLPEGAWVSDDPHVLCEVFLGRVLTATWTVAGRAESWPTELPATAECRNGAQRVPFALAFRLGDRDAFVANSGTLVVPHDGEAPLAVRWQAASPAVSAIALGPDRGVACGVNGGGDWTLQLGPSSLAGPLVCQLTLASGVVVENEVLVVRTRR
jgi:hypothetical protein